MITFVSMHVNEARKAKLILISVFSLIQNNPAVKKVCDPKKTIVKKDVKSKVAAKKWL